MLELKKSKNYKLVYDDMLDQFPRDELKPYENFVKIFGSNYILYEISDDRDIGYIVLFEYLDFIFIDYIAIYKEFQSKGYGSLILDNLKESFKQKKGLLLEVEKEDMNNPNTKRRIAFYKKNGAELVNINYLYPNRNGCLPMDLYFIPYKLKELKISELKDFIKGLFDTVHSDIEHREEVLSKIFR